MNSLAVKVGSGLAGGVASATLPSMLSRSLSAGWPGVGVAGALAFGGSFVLRGMSQNASEGWLIGGLLQTAGRIAQLLLGRNLVSFSMGQYGPMQFPVPTPAYNLKAGPSVTPMVPASASASTPSRPRNGTGVSGYGHWGPKASKWSMLQAS